VSLASRNGGEVEAHGNAAPNGGIRINCLDPAYLWRFGAPGAGKPPHFARERKADG
jgi:hypothetical protein